MHQIRPLPDTHPEFTVTHWQGFTEYRVEHWRLARNGSGRIVRGTCVWSWVDAGVLVVALVVLLAWSEVRLPILIPIPVSRSLSHPVLVVSIGIVLIYLVWARCTQVLHESVLVFPTLGIQLESHLGHPLFHPISTTHHFIPLSALEDVIVHEGFRRWDVRFFLAALHRTGTGTEVHSALASRGVVQVRVAFENILPYFPILHAVYLDVQQTLFPSPTRVVEMDGP